MDTSAEPLLLDTTFVSALHAFSWKDLGMVALSTRRCLRVTSPKANSAAVVSIGGTDIDTDIGVEA
jgi:hypothetical protein